jgi:riboflavin kinase/FMN adenylyltransferase
LRLIEAARDAVGDGGRVVVLSFDPHPRSVLQPSHALERLTTFATRRALLCEHGADEVVGLDPSNGLLGLTPEAFLKTVVDEHHPSFIVEGPDFRFGRDRAGTVQTLRDHEATGGFQTRVIDPVEAVLSDCAIVEVSSSLTRWMLNRGRVRDASLLLGRPYAVGGTVRSGARKGRSIGVPTANLDTGDVLLPADGVYAGRARLYGGREFVAAISVGTKPTFGDHPRVCEAHLLDFDGPVDHYEWAMELSFVEWLRDQVAFSGVEALRAQLRRDIAATRAVGIPSPA